MEMASAVDSKKSPEPAKDRPQHPSNWLTRLRDKNTNTNGREKSIMLQEEEAINSAMPPNHSCVEEITNKAKKQKNKRYQQREKKFLNKAKAKVEREPTATQRKREKIFFSKMGFRRKEKVTIQIQRKLVPPSSKFQSAAKGDMEVVDMVRLYREQYHRHDRPLPFRRVKENINHIVPVHSHQEGARNEVLYASENAKESMQCAPKILYQAQSRREEANNNTHDKYGDESSCCSSSNGFRNKDSCSRSNSDDEDSDNDNDSDDGDTRNLSLDENSTLVSSITMPRALRSPTGKHLIQSLGACFSDVSQVISSSITCTCLDENGYGQVDPKPVESFDTLMDDLIDRVQVIEVMSKDTKIINKGSTIEEKGKCSYKSDSCKNTFAIASDNSATVSATSSF